MKRRSFIQDSLLLSTGCLLSSKFPLYAKSPMTPTIKGASKDMFRLFEKPDSIYRPFVRWWWNGDKVEAKEIIRELHLLKAAGIGGVEINPISFPLEKMTDDLGKKSLRWLSNEWIDMVKVACDEAKRIGLTCDLIVGSGWPLGSEDLKENERAEVVLVSAQEIQGPTRFKCSEFHIFNMVDPTTTVVNPLRSMDILSLTLVPDPMGGVDETIDVSDQIGKSLIEVDVPVGKHVLYALVNVKSFAEVINGAPGAAGSILNHIENNAMPHYLTHMSDAIENRIGKLSNYVRAMFVDGFELEGSNWASDMAAEFKRRRGYDVTPYVPFILFKTGRLGGVIDDKYGAEKTPEFENVIERVRYDFVYTKAELIHERATQPILKWCRDLEVKSRVQSYGQGTFPMHGSLESDIPEGESWTTNWLRHKLGEEMGDEDYRRGRGYTMINKYVSSAANLSGKREVSSEEMTNTYLVFNATLELLKIGSDMSVISGITHPVWHGFNYSPKETKFPGWVQYGAFHNEKNNWWPYVHYLNNYRARVSSQLENADMYTDMAILPANGDMWSERGARVDPFPDHLNVPYTSLLWEAINKCGGASDYTMEEVIQRSTVKEGNLCYGPKQYSTLFLPGVKRIHPETLKKLLAFVQGGGRVFCIDTYPEKSLGFEDYKAKDLEVQQLLEQLKGFPEQFILVKKPSDNKFLEWYDQLRSCYHLPHYIEVKNPDRFVMQNRYQDDDKNQIIFLTNVHRFESKNINLTFSKELTKGRNAWIWDIDNGERYRLNLTKEGRYTFDLGPAESLLIVFDHHRGGVEWKPLPVNGKDSQDLTANWDLELQYSLEDKKQKIHFDLLKDLKEDVRTVNFCGTAVYRKQINVVDPENTVINLGRVYGISEVFVNGRACGVKWYGRRIHELSSYLKVGVNEIEIHVITVMGNYMKTMKDNEVAQFWVNRKGREQEIQSMGLVGPVTFYKL